MPRLLPRASGHVAGDGRDALGRRLPAVAPRHARARTCRSMPSSPRPRHGHRVRKGCCSCRTSPASGRRTPIPTPAARSWGSSCATIAARSSGRCSRAWRSASRTRSTCFARSVSRQRAARVSGGGARSRLWLEIVASVLGVPLELTESEEGSAFGAALLGGVAGGVFRDVDEAVARCVRVDEHGRAEHRVVGRLPRGARALPRAVPGSAGR